MSKSSILMLRIALRQTKFYHPSMLTKATNHLTKCGVRHTRGVVKEVHPTKLVLSDGAEEVPYRLLVWSTGAGLSQFVKSLNVPKSPGGRIGIDQWLRVPAVEDVFALGDCAGFLEQTGRPVLQALAPVEPCKCSSILIWCHLRH
ncbi:internal alternative NAD(P)H-ubiquinone oxidoreductase A2, mitochondrial-like [Manihot esculenta]|uniref:internal alternative NAD(P)H-ubiquinone oxidoreductase A2, mitochondrial-like n=1 Tax=Manihot esculenta TaxID=3983 RepID=UPI000B5D8622|nr:internal alternative NAD(P)H-ubiquinone oxidoreductase A2, mitochondrial-like [Manihot esculenta]XP_043808256.1 internal alternative NAD(P)H-ubiquinone oxidoreductase A2, mitochondrial-like [Manihot esculenta]XP_043808257.1 internal alternative NAD(P)H-ubiquinone oxidoreductase A2, mitochondrial-like [Manihot esculenta]XP_043808258.1 internal alternative NAD(P)H-ubiquinone oxidoreductase A2, mitochondrial-like [Manihot esculenta]